MTARLKTKRIAAGPAALAAVVLTGMLASPGDAQSQSARTHTVVMANMRFGQMPASVRRGDVIVWVNRDTVPHTATARNRSFDIRVAPRASARMVVRAGPGNVPVYCVLHPAMRTTMRVVQ
jgi:plastocyanin